MPIWEKTLLKKKVDLCICIAAFFLLYTLSIKYNNKVFLKMNFFFQSMVGMDLHYYTCVGNESYHFLLFEKFSNT